MTEPTMERSERADYQATSDPALQESADRGEVELLSYAQLYSLWERQQWSVQDLDFTQDRIDWHERIPADERFQRMYGLSSFFIGEQRVAAELGPMMRAAPQEDMRVFLCTQIADEARHVQFFDRFYSEVGVLEADNLQDRLEETSAHLNENFTVLFDDMLAGKVDRLAREPEDLETLVEAVTLYHMVIEGMLALTGQHFIMEYNESIGTLPAFVEGFGNVSRDEHRHVAFGARFLRDMARRDERYRDAIQRTLVESGPAADGVLKPPWYDESENAEVFGYTMEETRAFAMKALERTHEGHRPRARGLTRRPAADRDLGVRAQQDDAPLLVGQSEHQHLGHDWPDLPGREVDHGHDQPALQLLARVVGDLSRRALGADLGAEVDLELPGGLARLGEVVHRQHAPGAHVDAQEVVERDQLRRRWRRRLRGRGGLSRRGRGLGARGRARRRLLHGLGRRRLGRTLARRKGGGRLLLLDGSRGGGRRRRHLGRGRGRGRGLRAGAGAGSAAGAAGRAAVAFFARSAGAACGRGLAGAAGGAMGVDGRLLRRRRHDRGRRGLAPGHLLDLHGSGGHDHRRGHARGGLRGDRAHAGGDGAARGGGGRAGRGETCARRRCPRHPPWRNRPRRRRRTRAWRARA